MDIPELYVPDTVGRILPEIIEIGPSIHSGAATFTALKDAVEELTRTAPKDCDILIRAYDLTVREIRFVEPHAFIFSGVTDDGHDAREVIHFSQLHARVIYRPKDGPNRVIIGFAQTPNKALQATAAAPASGG